MMDVKWLFGIAAGIILGILAIFPQYNLQTLRGGEFQGAFASCDLDEMAYASYLQAVIDGRPRKNDPYTGRDQSEEKPQHESLFSVQFLPAYLVGIPAKILGLSASQILPYVSFFSAFFTALALFWLIVSITGDNLTAFTATLIVIVGSALIIGIGAINGFYENGVAYPFFPFLRRYIPSVAFPFMFAFFACLWNGLKAETKEKRAIFSALASLCFAAQVFSYFYVWTAAAAVLFSLTLFAVLFRSENWRKDFEFLFITSGLCLLVLAPYAVLLSDRNSEMDKTLLLVFTRGFDLLRTVEVYGFVILGICSFAFLQYFSKSNSSKAHFALTFLFSFILVSIPLLFTIETRQLDYLHYFLILIFVVSLMVLLMYFGVANTISQVMFSAFKERKLYLIAALALAPVLVFNQQVLTNRSLQPFHYEFYVINYVVLLAIVLIVLIFWQRFISPFKQISVGLLSVLALAAILWGYIEARDTTVFWDSTNIQRDDAMPVNLRLRELAQGNVENAKRTTTLNLEPLQADSQPTVAPQSVLWARHQHVFAGIESWEENKRRYYQLLYFSDLDAAFLRRSLIGCQDIEACMALFGWDRFNARLSVNARPLTLPEIEEEVRTYDNFVKNYSVSDAQDSQIQYLVIFNDAGNELKNFTRWFERDAGEILGKYTLYRVKLKEN